MFQLNRYDVVTNNTKSMNMDKISVASSLLSSWLLTFPNQTGTGYSN
jgi:hypothetical protein